MLAELAVGTAMLAASRLASAGWRTVPCTTFKALGAEYSVCYVEERGRAFYSAAVFYPDGRSEELGQFAWEQQAIARAQTHAMMRRRRLPWYKRIFG